MAKSLFTRLSWIFISMMMVRFGVGQPALTNCSLDFSLYSLPGSNSSCMEGDWGGFLNKNSCGSAFFRFLYALGLRANQTGLIYLNSAEQRSCLASVKNFEPDVFGCRIEKLTSGGGGCSDFSAGDVSSRLQDELRSLSESCRLVGPDGDTGQTCDYCVKTWQNIKSTESIYAIAESLNGEADWDGENDICRFIVLVSLTSGRIDDKNYVQTIYECLVKENNTFAEDGQALAGKRKAKIGLGAWILVGVLVGGAAIIIIACKSKSRRSCKPKLPPEQNAFKNLQLKKSSCTRFSVKEVYSATMNLNQKNLIGEGTAGKVYKGILSNNQRVAIKHIINDGNVETVVRELASLSHVRHPNLVALLGYCVREDECFLVYELCPNGNLSEWIFGKENILSWIQRLEIAIDSARGLWFLHTYSEGCIVHRDIKPTNILLGPNFEAKLSDFGLSKVIDLGETNVSSEVRGTFGYVDPDYQNDRQVNSLGDVYSFGVVLLQILSGKKVINMNLKKPMPLDKMAKLLTRVGSEAEFADPKLEGEYSAEAFSLTFQLALSCTSIKQQRPSMEKVVAKLEEALDISTRAKASTPETTPNRFSAS